MDRLHLIELVRAALAVTFLTVTLYSVARLAWSFAPKGTRAAGRVLPGERTSDITHALMGLALAVMVAADAGAVPTVTTAVVFAILAARFVTFLRHHGATSRAGGGHGGYNLHHLAACLAMIYIYATGHVTAGRQPGDTAASHGGTAESATLMAHHGLAPLTSISWLFGLYFLVAATSLGFRVAEPAVRVTHRIAVPAGMGGYVAPVPRAAPAKLLSSPAGQCASEVITSGGIAFMLFSSV